MKRLFGEHKLFSVAIIVELIVLIMLIGLLFAPRTGYGLGGISIDGRHEIGGLTSGKYIVTVDYNVPATADPSHANVIGSLKIGKLEGEGIGLLSTPIYLRADSNEETGAIWIRPGYGKYSTFYAECVSGNPVSEPDAEGWIDVPEEAFGATITSVSIDEVYSYRFVRILMWILMSFALDVIIAFFADVVFKSDRQQKYVAMSLIAAVVFVSLLCLNNVIYVNPGHDLQIHLQRIVSVADGLRAGQIPHRMAENLNNGYGYASPLFYPELFLVIPGAMYAIGLPLQTAYLTYVVLINIATVALGYYCFWKMSGSRKWGCFAAVLYELSAFRLTDIYQRQSLGEYTAFAFLPLVVYGFYRLYAGERQRRYTFQDALPLIVGCSLVVESHILSCYLIAVFGLLFMLINAKKTFAWCRLKWLLVSAACIICINLWYLVPMIDSMRSIDGYYGYFYNLIGKSGAYPSQLLGVFHTWGGVNVDNGTTGEMPLTIGISLVMGLMMIPICYISRQKWQLEGEAEYKRANMFFGYACLSMLLASYVFPWDVIESLNWRLIKLFGIVQFPWRYLTIATVCAVFAVMYILQILEKKGYKKAGIAIAVAIVVMNLVTEGYTVKEFADSADTLVVLTSQDIDYQMDMLYLPYGASVDDSDYSMAIPVGDGYDMPKYYYPNYHAYDVNSGAELSLSKSDNGKIHVSADISADDIVITYKEPVLWRVCSKLSLASVCLLLFFLVWKRWKVARR